MRVSVIIPTRNEAEVIGDVLSRIPQDIVDEVIVVDSSMDDTPKIAESAGAIVVNEPKLGYGWALETGVKKARGEVVAYIDGDNTYDFGELCQIVEPILRGECDIVLGSRLKGDMHNGSMASINKFGNITITLLFNLLFAQKISDTQCGLRAIRKKFLDSVECENHGMPYVTEQLIRLIRKGARLREVPITYRRSNGRRSKLNPFKDGFRIMKTMISCRLASSGRLK